MIEDDERTAVVSEARTWIGTPFHDCAAIKGVGVDCAQLVRAVANATKLRNVEDTGEYSPQWFLHRDGEKLAQFILRYATEIEVDRIGPGDVVAYKIGRAFSHAAIVSDRPGHIIHAHMLSGCVVETPMDAFDLMGRERRYFSPWT